MDDAQALLQFAPTHLRFTRSPKSVMLAKREGRNLFGEGDSDWTLFAIAGREDA